ncbi:3-dehydroquinate dehydratase [Desulfosarcina cetonica]|uniref:type I 3-dehydroquinate dehydratase n=1 Tax=Desulfosarcina cetonica TaxID=90730 RepID=UPI0006D1518B|nr:type I 3-dehydroquinate dehydratase [Desulfosarcina cetonica]VTR68634.1 3-dehydroquinate dehydratase [Desulfosarcina cetonica]
MRQESEIPVRVRQAVIGGPKPLICIPLVAAEKNELFDQAAEMVSLGPDLLEWRADGYRNIADIADGMDVLTALRSRIGDTPLIFTCRIAAEGGMQPLPQPDRLRIIQAAIRSGAIDLVDIELINDAAFIEGVRDAAKSHGVKLILSAHDFNTTPPADVIIAKLSQAQARGADVAKLAVMPTDYADVLTLLTATLRARSEVVKIPMITISMAGEGALTRLAGGLFGSDITFAAGRVSSAPGQLPIDALRQAMSLLYA